MAAQSGTERFLLDGLDGSAVDRWLDAVLRAQLGVGVEEVIFRAGRIDAVFALRLRDGREVVLKVHRGPVDLAALADTVAALRTLAEAGYPCPTPLGGPWRLDGRVVTVETLLTTGTPPDAARPATRRVMIAGLLAHIELLRAVEAPAIAFGVGPPWTRYQDGLWPVPHDAIFDFTATPDGYRWLDDFAAATAAEANAYRTSVAPVLGHADWYAANLLVDDDRLVGAFDWDLVRQHEPMVIGFSAAYFHADRPSTAAEVVAFLDDVDDLRRTPFTAAERRIAAVAAGWTMAFNARCELALLDGEVDPHSSLGLLRDDRAAYRAIGA